MAGRLVSIGTFEHLTDAHAAKNALEAAGVQAALDNEQTSSLFGSVLPMIGIRVVVREEDEAKAVQVLDETFGNGDSLNEVELAAQAEAAPAEDPVDAGQQLPTAADPVADSLAREKEARTALLAACLGLLVPCVSPFATLFAIVMIVQASNGPGHLSGTGKRHVYAAGLIVLLPWLLLLIVLLALQGRDW